MDDHDEYYEEDEINDKTDTTRKPKPLDNKNPNKNNTYEEEDVYDDDDEEDDDVYDDDDDKKHKIGGAKDRGTNDDDDDADDDDDDDDDDADDDAGGEEDDDDVFGQDDTNANNDKKAARPSFMNMGSFSEDEDETGENDSDDEYENKDVNYLQKFDDNINKNIISEFHPELQTHNTAEIEALSHVVRDENGIIIDPLHRTVPFITRYEKARIIGERAKQLNCGAKPMIEIDPSVIDGYLIALKEYDEKKIPFIIKRPLPNGGCEYWKIDDLEQL